jgi:hypothetical protein
MTNRLLITVDVEAFPKRAEMDHVDRLIWGKYPDGRGGIGEMMSIAEKHGVRLVMFLDYVEEFLYGKKIVDVAREIHARGHDLQLHSHPELFPSSFWAERGLPHLKHAGDATDEQAEALFDFLCDAQLRATGVAPVAYRGGGYRFGPGTVRAMGTHGVRMNSSYLVTSDNQLFRAGRLPQFKWDNGCVEVPISSFNMYKAQKKTCQLNFNHESCADIDRMMMSLDAFYRQMGDETLAVLVMHSWSFSRELDNGHFSTPVLANIKRFEQFLEAISRKVEIVDCAAALKLIDSGEIPIAGIASTGAMDKGMAALQPITSASDLSSTASYFRNMSYPDRLKVVRGRWKWYLGRARAIHWGLKLGRLIKRVLPRPSH